MGREMFESRGLGGREALMEDIKTKAGELDDLIRSIAQDSTESVPSAQPGVNVDVSRQRPGECKRLTAMACTSLENAVMQAVKAISRGQ